MCPVDRQSPSGSGKRVQLGVVGAGEAGEGLRELAREVGFLAAGKGWILLTGGMGGVMEAASEGAAAAGGVVIGILPGTSRKEGNRHLGISLPTGLGHARNAVIAQAADLLIAVGGGYGTLSEMALGLKMGKPVISLRSWKIDPSVTVAETASEALKQAEERLTGNTESLKGV